MKVRKKWLEVILLIVGIAALLTLMVYAIYSMAYDHKESVDESYQTTIESYSIQAISLDTKTVEDTEYQILNMIYYNPDGNLDIHKSILVDMDARTCLWNSKDGIDLINSNQKCNAVYDNFITFTEGDKNEITIIRKFYTKDVEMASLLVEITLTPIVYESIIS